MSALPDSDDDELDSFDLMEIENRLSFAVGYAFQRTYLEEYHFTLQLAIFSGLLAEKQKKYETFSICDAATMFLGTAYRAAKTSRLVFAEAQNRRNNPKLFDKLMLIHHDLNDSAIHPLYTLLNYLKQVPVLEILGVDKEAVRQCFFDGFGENFVKARNAIAHDDDRMVRADVIEYPLISRIGRTQHRATTGAGFSGLHVHHSDGEHFDIEFTEANFLKLLASLSKLIEK